MKRNGNYSNKMKKSGTALMIIVSCFASAIGHTQDIITKYFDSSWRETGKGSPYFYYTTFEKQDTGYRVTSYWSQSNKITAVSVYADTNFRKGIGLSKGYYESGVLKDSFYFDDKGGIQVGYHYHESGRLDFSYHHDATNGGLIGERYDSTGKKVPGYFTYQKEAMFPGGADGWIEYLQAHLKANTPAKKKAPVGRYTVTITFLVDKNGKVTEVEALNDPGYGTAEEAVRVVQHSPAWIPAIQNDKPVNYRQKENITFEVTEK